MDRLGQLVVRTIEQDSRFKEAVQVSPTAAGAKTSQAVNPRIMTQVPKGMDTKKGLNYVVDGLEMGFPDATQVSIPDGLAATRRRLRCVHACTNGHAHTLTRSMPKVT